MASSSSEVITSPDMEGSYSNYSSDAQVATYCIRLDST